MQRRLQVILPCQLPLLLISDPHRLVLIHLQLLLRHVVPALLLKLRQLYTDTATSRSDLRLIQHLDCHVDGFKHRVADSCIALGFLSEGVPVDLELLGACGGVQAEDAASHEVISELTLGDVGGEALDVDVVIDLGLEPLALLVFLVALLLQSLLLSKLKLLSCQRYPLLI